MLDVVIDISHHNGNLDLAAAHDAGLLGVIQKATQGTTYVDPTLTTNRAAALAAGLLVGVYHFGTGAASGQAQAEYLLANAKPGDLLALDLEQNPSGAPMSLAAAAEFVEAITAETGVTPLLYTGGYIKDLIAGGAVVPDQLTGCPLWLAQYGPSAKLPRGWSDWALWQYTDGNINAAAGPGAWTGIGPADRDRFNGDDQVALTEFWRAHALP